MKDLLHEKNNAYISTRALLLKMHTYITKEIIHE